MRIEISGAKELAAKLAALPDKVADKYMNQALKEGAREVAAYVVEAAPVGTDEKAGTLAASVHVSSKKGEATVGAIFYGRFLNDGTTGRSPTGERKTRKGLERARKGELGGLVGAIKATHWMTNAAKAATPDALEAVADSLREKIQAE